MPERVTMLQVFIASPGDVQAERDAVEAVVTELNRSVAPARGLTLQTVRWELDVRPGVGADAQDVVNRQIGPRDVFVGILWSRLGTRTRRARSGTVEEFELAFARHREDPRMELLVYFKTEPPPQDDARGRRDQAEVHRFRQQVQVRGALTAEFADTRAFEGKLRTDLTKILMDWGRPARARRPAGSPARPTGKPVVLFAEGYGQDAWNGGAATLGDGYQRIGELTAGRQLAAEAARGRINAATLGGVRCLVFAIGPWGRSRLEVGELRALHRFVEDGGALLLLCNYAGQQHHGGNLNDLSVRYGLTFEADAVTPAGIDERTARRQHAARPGAGFGISARPARAAAGQGAPQRAIRQELTDGVRRVAALTPCSVTPRPDAVAVVVAEPRYQVMEARYTAWSPNVDEWVPTDRRSPAVVAASSVARVAAVGGWKTFHNALVDDPRFDNARLWENLVGWLCRRT
jgi:hypothetical protein